MNQQQDQGPAILYFGNDWFAENRTSSHQIARRLARRYRVYYIECPGMRAPQGTGRDLKKIWTKLVRAFQGSRQAAERLTVQTLLQVPLHRFAPVRWLNRLLIAHTLRKLIRRQRLERTITWFMIPHVSSVLGKLGEQLSVYYCTDDHGALPGVDEEAIRRMDEDMTRNSDLVFVASHTLHGDKQRLNANTHVSPHGVDIKHFARAQSADLAVPADTASLPGPVVGFFGLIERWIDLELVDYLAQQRPQWTFLMIGRVAVPQDEIPRRPNLHLIGKRAYEQLPAYGKQFDAAIIPYRLNRQVMHANPIKLREYLAMGKPVVSVSTPEIDKYADVVSIARSREDFLAQLDAALARPSSTIDIERRMRRVAGESWDSRMEGILEVVNRHLTPQMAPAS
jgi:glycosyltransferase involved in cell wall biosynthesis